MKYCKCVYQISVSSKAKFNVLNVTLILTFINFLLIDKKNLSTKDKGTIVAYTSLLESDIPAKYRWSSPNRFLKMTIKVFTPSNSQIPRTRAYLRAEDRILSRSPVSRNWLASPRRDGG